jgi:hypothetical protein
MYKFYDNVVLQTLGHSIPEPYVLRLINGQGWLVGIIRY